MWAWPYMVSSSAINSARLFFLLSGGSKMLVLRRPKVVQGQNTDAWSLAAKDRGRSMGLDAGTNLDSRSSVIGDDRRGLVENTMNKKQGEEAATLPLDRPPREPPP
ncbi:unnamed protein product [Cuscuta europaea]|uniref:Uncharacterized protein n=1 Tax=Cuscuta europaea TaxID=41803 RepID=A0A9P0YVZ9_CUSEU|nr:unnamed protein product [Cuscuta europaea]